MTCAKCGAEMNHQASKLVHALTEEEAASLSPAFEGVIEDVFACPRCGWIDSRRASPDVSAGRSTGTRRSPG